jgi:hypothetical protein
MVEDKRRRTSARAEKVRDPRSIKKFLEELSWVLTSYSNLDFRAIAEAVDRAESSVQRSLDGYVPKNPNIQFLIGALPGMFSDEKLFPSNEAITEFATATLNLSIPRWDKRSRYELIGLIVCETSKLDDAGLALLVKALRKVVAQDPNAEALFRNTVAHKLNWNEIIQQLTSEK